VNVLLYRVAVAHAGDGACALSIDQRFCPQEADVIYQGSCHCGAIRFEVEAPADLEVDECNCSICTKSGYLHLIVPRSKFRLLAGEEHIITYTFNTGVAKHQFCDVCGIKPYYIPRSNPDGYDVNVRCLDTRPRTLSIAPFDGQDWESHARELSHKSLET
jgi:hypothetical protein